MFLLTVENSNETQSVEEGKVLKAINFPVGKPLEVNSWKLPSTLALIMCFQIFIDGPYGAPSSHIFRAQHAVLVGTGIGVTPFASILQSIMHRYWKGSQCLIVHKRSLWCFLWNSSKTFVSKMWLCLGVWNTTDYHEPEKGGLFLDQPGSEIIWMVR